jgi:hypothetical protein
MDNVKKHAVTDYSFKEKEILCGDHYFIMKGDTILQEYVSLKTNWSAEDCEALDYMIPL